MTFTFLRNDGQFKAVNSGDISTSTSTNTSALLSFLSTSISNANIATVSTTFISIAQGSSGTWLAIGAVSLQNAATTQNWTGVLTDGATTISQGVLTITGTNFYSQILSGILASPAGNIRITGSVGTTSSAVFRGDSILSVIRIA